MSWKKIVFTNEKKFNLDGPDGLQYYWHNLRIALEIFSRQAQGGRLVMAWRGGGNRDGGISYKGTIDLVGISSGIDVEHYVNVLDRGLLHTAERLFGEDWTFK